MTHFVRHTSPGSFSRVALVTSMIRDFTDSLSKKASSASSFPVASVSMLVAT